MATATSSRSSASMSRARSSHDPSGEIAVYDRKGGHTYRKGKMLGKVRPSPGPIAGSRAFPLILSYCVTLPLLPCGPAPLAGSVAPRLGSPGRNKALRASLGGHRQLSWPGPAQPGRLSSTVPCQAQYKTTNPHQSLTLRGTPATTSQGGFAKCYELVDTTTKQLFAGNV